MTVSLHNMINNKGDIIEFSNFNNTLTTSVAFHGEANPPGEDTTIPFRLSGKLPSIEELEFLPSSEGEDVCVPDDERIRVTTPKAYPWRSICRLIITRDDGLQAVGTGWLNGEGTIITAGHCVFSPKLKKWHKSIIIIPGKNHNEEPYERYTSTNFWSVSGWVQYGNKEYDYGAVILGDKIGKSVGYLGFRADSNSAIENEIIVNSGYPADKENDLIDTQWYMKGTIRDLTNNSVSYMIDTYGGNSGGPVWIDNELYQTICIHAYGGCPNSGTRINKEVFSNLIKWKEMGLNWG